MKEDGHRYDDMLNLPHHVSGKHPRMSVGDRAAQFSPFAALTGFEAVIQETVRRTERKMELDDYQKAELDEKLRIVKERVKSHPEIAVVYFVPDEQKEGGAYVTARGKIKKIDEYEHVLVMEDGTVIPVGELRELIPGW